MGKVALAAPRRATAVFGLCLALGLHLPAAEQPLKEQDVRWLNRVTYGLDSATLARYRAPNPHRPTPIPRRRHR